MHIQHANKKISVFDRKGVAFISAENLLDDLRHDLLVGNLMLFYQVQVNESFLPIGAEALLRWNHKTLGLVPPSTFIPLAEKNDLIVDIGNWVLIAAFKQLHEWTQSKDTSHLTLSVNVSARQFEQDNFVEVIFELLCKYSFPISRLNLEMTESTEINDLDAIIDNMTNLRSMGVVLSIDDFGVGYSCLKSIKILPVHQIKIDKSFTENMVKDTKDAKLVKMIIELAENFGKSVVAEGVENKEQLALLVSFGCNLFQGYHFSRALPITGFHALLSRLGQTPKTAILA